MLNDIKSKQERFWHMNDCTFILFGASGDLAKRKLFPALYRLYTHKLLSKLVILGVGLEHISVEKLCENAAVYIDGLDPELYTAFSRCIVYEQMDITKDNDFTRLADRIITCEKRLGMSGNRIFYLATASHFFCQITTQLYQAQLAKSWVKDEKTYHRIVYEKPFGHDLVSAQQINECISQYYNEKQIYRIDHYLSKELVSNIALLRFTNCVLEPLWNNRYIDSVQIILSETVAVGNRGSYYDQYGALCDVVQNHMLEMVALLGMESPERLTGDYIRNQRARVLQHIVVEDVMRAQYEGYKDEQGVSKTSTTETFALVKLMINNARWVGVPFYLKTGKCLDKKETVIVIKFKQVDCLLTKNCPTDSNYLTIRITPNALFSLTLNAKKPGKGNDIVPISMDFAHNRFFGPVTPEAYEIIFQEIMHNEQSISVRFDEIESAWRTVDSMQGVSASLYTYKPGSQGPQEITHFEQKHGMKWKA